MIASRSVFDAAAPALSAPGGLQALALLLFGLVLAGGLAANLWLWDASRTGAVAWRRGGHVLIGRPVSWLDLLWIVAIVFTASGLCGLAYSLVAGGEAPSGARAIVITSLAVHWPVVIGIGLLVGLRGASWESAFGIRRREVGPDLRCGLVAYLAMTPVVFAHLVINWILLRVLNVEPELQDVAMHLLRDDSPSAMAYKGFTAVILAPVAEELLFRGIAFPLLARKFRPAGGMLAVSALFAAVHGEPEVMLPLFAVSMTLCAGYLASRSILVPIVMHMLFNGMNLWLMSVLLGASGGIPG